MDKHEHRGAGDRLVFCSSNRAHVSWATNTLNEWQVLQKELVNINELATNMPDAVPRLILLDFSGDCGQAQSDNAFDMNQLAQLLKKSLPNIPLVAIGSMHYPEGAVATLRAGIHHFIDMSASEDEAREVIRKLLSVKLTSDQTAEGSIVTLLGSRPGIGTTTLAVHLADILQQHKSAPNQQRRIALLDLGYPIGDGLLYLNIPGNFTFSDIVRNRLRMDQTLIHTALSGTANGMTRGAPVTLDSVGIGPIDVRYVDAMVVQGDMQGSLLGMSFLNKLSGYQVTGDRLVLRQ